MNDSDWFNISEDERITALCEKNGSIGLSPCIDFPLQHSTGVEIFVWMAFSLLIATSLIGNAIVMWIIVNYKAMHNGFNYFLFNMALSDFTITLLNAGSTWTYNFYYEWYYPNLACPFNHFFGVAPICSSIFSMMVISHDRCLAIVNPLSKRAMSKKRSCILIVIIWVISILVSLPSIIGAKIEYLYVRSLEMGYFKKRKTCRNEFDHKAIYEDILFIVQYILPLLVLFYTYARIVHALNKHKIPNLSQKSGNHMRDKKKVVKMLGLSVSTFMVCWLPYQLYHMLAEYFAVDPFVNVYLYLVFYWLAMSSTMYKPLIYCFYNIRFRIGFTYIFRWLPFVNFSEWHRNKMFPNSRNPTIRLQKLTGSVSTPLRLTSSPTKLRRSQSPNSATSLTLS